MIRFPSCGATSGDRQAPVAHQSCSQGDAWAGLPTADLLRPPLPEAGVPAHRRVLNSQDVREENVTFLKAGYITFY